MSSPLLRSAVPVGFSSLVLTPLLITPPSLQLDSRSSAQCLAVGVCFCFHQLLDEGSRMAYKVVFNLIIMERHLRQPFHYCLYCQLGSSFQVSEHFPSARFLVKPIRTPFIMVSLFLLSCIISLTHSSCSLMSTSLLLFSPSLWSLYWLFLFKPQQGNLAIHILPFKQAVVVFLP